MRGLLAGLVVPLLACERVPARVFVQGTPFRHDVRVTTEQGDRASVVVGQPLRLHATRKSGPWIEKLGSEAPEDGCWTEVARSEEPEVAALLRWHTEPSGFSGLDVPTLVSGDDRTRTIRFSRAGEYRLSATSAVTCSTEVSNVVVVSVREE